MSMYIKIKRQRQTIFLNCEPGDTIISLKQKIKAINSVPAEDQRLIVPEDKVVCDDNKTVRECKLEDGMIVALVYRRGTESSQEWEDIEIHRPGETPASPVPPHGKK
mmetsp:Transcript_31209/g.83737  ORF Transcript_31209/g.83737 Transcript_31209/m.83737 type:complete len:107 (-) Transcript_31209:8-328(-)